MTSKTIDNLAPMGQERVLAQRMREMEQKFADLEDNLGTRIDELFALVANASLDSQRIQTRTGTREGEWMEGSHV